MDPLPGQGIPVSGAASAALAGALPGQMVGANRLVQVAGPGDIAARDRAVADAAEAARTPQVLAISAHIDACFELAKREKSSLERRILDGRRRERGEYDAATLAQIREYGGSETWIPATATKCTAAMAWLSDLLLTSQDRSWGLEPTPVPDLPESALQAIVENVVAASSAQEAAGQGQMTPEAAYEMASGLRTQIMDKTTAEAAKRAAKMQDRIDDQLAEGGFWNALSEVIADLIVTPMGVLKGPVVRNRRRLAWDRVTGPDGTASANPNVKTLPVVEFEAIDPLDFYPAPNARTVQSAAFICERQQLSRRDIVSLKGAEGYSAEQIDAALAEYGTSGNIGTAVPDASRAVLENKPGYPLGRGLDTIEAVEFWGSVSGIMLKEWGLTVQDESAEYDITALKIGRHVVKCVLNEHPTGARPYYVTQFKPVKGSLSGQGLPEVVASCQDMQNAMVRHLQNNLAISSGPQVGVDLSALEDGFQWRKMYPWKVWPFKRGSPGTGNIPVTFFQPENNSAELMGVFKEFGNVLDDVSGVPRYLYGNDQIGGAGSTASGLSMLLNSAGKRMKLILFYLDRNIIEPVIREMHTFNMLYDPDESIKGDVNVVPQGAMALVAKEYGQQARMNILAQTNNPTDMQLIGLQGRLKLWRSVLQAMNIPEDTFPTDEEMTARMNAMAEQQAMAQQQKAMPMPPAQAPQPGVPP
jgi:hypothetical protein